jgi:glycyl-tRNA synthetase beta chain
VAEFLLELFSEEIPARMQARAAAELKRLASDKLAEAGLAFDAAESFVTPRRLTLSVTGLPEKQPDTTEEKKGPKVGAPEKALDGFLRANGLSSVDEAERRETEKGTFYFVVRHMAGRPTTEVLAGIVPELARGLSWPKSMRWATYGMRYVRPLHGVLALFDGAPIAGELELGGRTLAFGRETRGHRFLAPAAFEVTSTADYRAKLEKAKVVLDPAERRERTRARAETLAAEEGLRVKDDPGLLEENVGLVEWPVVLMGRIDAQFMELPPEVLTVSMRTHQKYFALERADGSLAPRFLLVSNMETPDGGAAIVAGNERVLRARLSDAQFFWDQDRKESLVDRVSALQDVVFHARLGSLHHKVDRMEALAVTIAEWIAGANRDKVRSAALLAKADLTTGMVGEFPELQGVMGRYYALADGEAPEVAEAIADHYAPQGPNDRCPDAPVSVAVSLADKLDTLTGFFTIGEKPTGSKDPFALRRAALGVIRLIVENKLRLPLGKVLTEAFHLQPEDAQRAYRSQLAAAAQGSDHGIGAAEHVPHAEEALTGEVLDFLMDRLKVVLRDRGVRHDLISAVFAVEAPEGGPEDDLVRLLARVEALRAFLQSDDGANLLTAYRRAGNIVRIEEKKDKASYRDVEPALFQDAAEEDLGRDLSAVRETIGAALRGEAFQDAMTELARLRAPIDDFFEKVMVNTDDRAVRANRLALLHSIVTVMNQVADFSKIEG